MIQLLKKNNFILLGAILLAVLCTQVFPYIHFHHSHENENTKISSHYNHPVNTHQSEQHERDHHHDEHHRIIGDWNYVKTVSCSNLNIETNSQLVPNILYIERYKHIAIVYEKPNHPPPNTFKYKLDLSRGPPAPLS